MTKQHKPSQYDWQSRDITDWNANTFLAFIGDKTKELYGVDYAPGGTGAKSARWSRERGMLKNAQGRYGNAVLKRFIEICWREYRTNKPAALFNEFGDKEYENKFKEIDRKLRANE